MRIRAGRPGLIAVALTVACGAFAQGATANVYKPTTTADHIANGCSADECTLREAINAANAHSGDDRIVLKGGKRYEVTYAPANVEDENVAADLDINDDLTIVGKGRKFAILDAKHLNRVVDVGPGEEVAVKFVHVWIRNGYSAEGAAIRAGHGGTAALSLARSKVTGSRTISNGHGGGIKIENQSSGDSTLTVNRSTISGNKSSGDGAGIAAIDVGLVQVTASTISGNFAGYDSQQASGGGVFLINNFTELNLTNSTVANNRATGEGGGIDAFSAAVTVRSSTIVRNHADVDHVDLDTGGGISLGNSTVFEMINSILALNTAYGNGEDDCEISGATIGLGGRNLLSKAPTACTAFNVPSTIVQANPKLDKLGANGGPTKTVALLAGSKAINRASADSPARDQRGHKRQNPDIGSFERN